MPEGFDVQPELLREIERRLRSRASSLSSETSLGARPDAGGSSGEVAMAFAQVEELTGGFAEGLRHLADGVDASQRRYVEADDRVRARLDDLGTGMR